MSNAGSPICAEAHIPAAAGDPTYEQALSNFLTANPNADEPPTLLTRPFDDIAARILARLESTTGSSGPPGRTEPVIAPDSIVDTYDAGLATGIADASGSGCS